MKCLKLLSIVNEMYFNDDQPEDELKYLSRKALDLYNKGLICPHLTANLLCIANQIVDSEKRKIAYEKFKRRVEDGNFSK